MRRYDGLTLLQLREGALQGDEEARGVLLDRLPPGILRVLSAEFRHAPSDLIEEATQEALIRVNARLSQFAGRSEGEFARWVFRTARNCALDYLRRNGLAWNLIKEFSRSKTATLEFHDPTDEPEPARPSERVQRLTDLLAKMPPSTQDLIWQRIGTDCTWEEIAQEFGTTPSAAKRRYQRALAALKRGMLDQQRG